MDDETRDDRTRSGDRIGSDDRTVADDRVRDLPEHAPDPRTHSGPRIPAEIAGYRVLGVLGEGGMGVVLEAEQQEPRRRVALKMIRGGTLAGSRAIGMFQREVETLARLKHPGIAAIHASGTTDDGQPFLVMELVSGLTFDRYLARHRGPLVRGEIAFRIRLVAKIARAVHYAHQRGVIHRDLKPGNILVSTELADAEGIPEIKILDFGLARLVDDDGEGTRITEVGSVKGTLAYMSPEQARADPAEIDTRADVYALGVVLYESLAGVRPHTFETTSFVDAVRTVSERPVRPLREVWPSGAGRLDDDLATVVHTALATDVDRRYSGADVFARDLAHYLGNEPILARPPSTVYQVRKFAQRNRTLVAGVAATVLVLAAGIVVSTVLGLQEARQRRAAERARNDLEQVVAFQAKTLRDVDPEVTGRRLMAAIGRQLGDDGAPLIADLERGLNPTDLARAVLDENILAPAAAAAAREFGDQPLIEARLHHTLALTYQDLGIPAEAEAEFRRAAGIREREVGARAPETLESRARVARTEMLQGKLDTALARLDGLIETQAEVLGGDAGETLRSRYDRATVRLLQGDYAAALEEYEAVHAAQVAALDDDHPDSLQTLSAIASTHHRLGDYDAAGAAGERVVAVRTRTLGSDAELTLAAKGNLATVRVRQRRFDEAERLYLEVVEALRVAHGEEFPRTLRAMGNLGVLYTRTGRVEDAYALGAKTLEIRRRVLGPEHPETVGSMNNVAVQLTALGRYDEAAALLDEVLAIDERYAPGSPDHGIHLHTYAELRIEQQDWPDARRKIAAALDVYRATDHPNLGFALVQAAGIEARAGRPDPALDYLEQAVEAGHSRGITAEAPEFASLRADPRFKSLLARLAAG